MPLRKPWALSKSECGGGLRGASHGKNINTSQEGRLFKKLFALFVQLLVWGIGSTARTPYLAVSRCEASMTSSRQSADGASRNADINSDKIRAGSLTQPVKSRLSQRHKHVFSSDRPVWSPTAKINFITPPLRWCMRFPIKSIFD